MAGRWVPDRQRCRPFRVGPRDDGRWPARPASGERVRQDLADIAHPLSTEASPQRVTGNQARTRFVAAWQPDHVPPPVRQAHLPLRRRRAAPEPGVGPHRGWGDQDPHLADADVPEVVAAFGPFRGCPSRAGACGRRWHRSVARPPGPVNGQAVAAEPEGFAGARERFQRILGWLDGDSSTGLDHAELERQLDVEGRELLRQLLQDHVDLRAIREGRSRFGTPTGAVERAWRPATPAAWAPSSVRSP